MQLAGSFSEDRTSSGNVSTFLGEISSADLARLSYERRTSIRTFWHELLPGAAIHTDGVGHMQILVDRAVAGSESEPVGCKAILDDASKASDDNPGVK